MEVRNPGSTDNISALRLGMFAATTQKNLTELCTLTPCDTIQSTKTRPLAQKIDITLIAGRGFFATCAFHMGYFLAMCLPLLTKKSGIIAHLAMREVFNLTKNTAIRDVCGVYDGLYCEQTYADEEIAMQMQTIDELIESYNSGKDAENKLPMLDNITYESMATITKKAMEEFSKENADKKSLALVMLAIEEMGAIRAYADSISQAQKSLRIDCSTSFNAMLCGILDHARSELSDLGLDDLPSEFTTQTVQNFNIQRALDEYTKKRNIVIKWATCSLRHNCQTNWPPEHHYTDVVSDLNRAIVLQQILKNRPTEATVSPQEMHWNYKDFCKNLKWLISHIDNRFNFQDISECDNLDGLFKSLNERRYQFGAYAGIHWDHDKRPMREKNFYTETNKYYNHRTTEGEYGANHQIVGLFHVAMDIVEKRMDAEKKYSKYVFPEIQMASNQNLHALEENFKNCPGTQTDTGYMRVD